MFQRAGDRVEHLMTLILVFMGSPHRMKNPHLRAEFADMLSALMPPPTTSTGPSGGLLSRYVTAYSRTASNVSHYNTVNNQ